MRPLLVATRSPDKLREIRQILGDLPELRLLDLHAAGIPPDPAEDGIEVHDTFAANALAKARYFATRSGCLTLADDSGLCVDALGGEPGIRSRRFSGRDDLSGSDLDDANNRLLLQRLGNLPPDARTAHYACAVALADPDPPRETVAEGRCEGLLLDHPRGRAGFGYDPLFFLPHENATFGELPPTRKNEISHRAAAVRAALPRLLQWLGNPHDPGPSAAP